MNFIGSKIDEIRIDGNLENLKKDLDYFAKLGLEAVEIPVHGLDIIKNGFLDNRRVQEVVGILQRYDFVYTLHAPNPLNLMSQSYKNLHLSVFQASLEFCKVIGAHILVYHAGRFIPEEEFFFQNGKKIRQNLARQLLEMEREALKQLAEEFPKITISVENARPYLYHSPYCYGERLENLLEMIKKVNKPNVRINLDIGHLYMASQFYQFDPVVAIRLVSPYIAHTHIHDNFGKAIYHFEKLQTHQIPFGRGDSHMPIGWGEVPLADILSSYIFNYRGILMMELRSRYFFHTKESMENLNLLLANLKNIDQGNFSP